QWLTIDGVELIGFYDVNQDLVEAVHQEYKIPFFKSEDELLAACDAVDIVTTTTAHFEVAKKALLLGKHVFVEKPLTNTLEEARELIQIVQEANVKCQVGHVERYNPALLALKDMALQPMFIETHRLAQFNPRGTDVSVILDLMIHDIDIILHLVKSSIRRISASGVSVMSENPDIASARIEFDNGCVANLTSSRISMKKMRKTRIFQKDAYISLDFLTKKSEIVRLYNEEDVQNINHGLNVPIHLNEKDKKYIHIDQPHIEETNAIQQE